MYDTIYRQEDLEFEENMGINVSPPTPKQQFHFESKELFEHATMMGAINLRNLSELFEQVKLTGREYEFFYDYGSGCGKACFFASYQKIANRIVGIEYIQSIYEHACSNLKKSGLNNVEFQCANALDVQLPDAKTILFMFNPFDAELLERVLLRLTDHFRRNESIIVYANDCHRASFAKCGYETIYRNQVTFNSIYQSARPRFFAY